MGRRLSQGAVAVVLAGAAAGVTEAQGTSQPPAEVTASDANATRAALTASLAAADRRRDQTAAGTIRRRLAEGDMGPGDRIIVTITVDSVSRQELVVRDSQRVDVLPFGSLSLRGALRSELPAVFRRFYLQYYRDPQIRVETLIRVGFTGAFQKPGFYSVPPDTPIAEALAATAGGPVANADPKKFQVKRGDERLYDRKGYDRVAREGLTFAEAGLRSGDEFQASERKQRNTFQVLRTVVIAISAFTSVLFLIRSAYNS